MPRAFGFFLRRGLVLVPLLAAMMAADDPVQPADPWLRKSVYPKRPDVRARDAKGKPKGEPIRDSGFVMQVAGQWAYLKGGILKPDIGWVAKADFVLANEAEAYFSELIKANPTPFAFQARAASRQGRFNQANKDKVAAANLADLEEAIRLDPGDYRSYLLRGRLRARKDEDRQIADYGEALARVGTDVAAKVEILQGRANFYEFQRKHDLGSADVEEALKVASGDRRLSSEILMMRGARRRFLPAEKDAALVDFEKAIALADDERSRAQALRLRAHLWADMRNYDRAIADIDQAIRLDPSSPMDFGYKGDYLQAKGDPAGAIAEYTKILAEAPRLAPYLIKRAKAYSAAKDDVHALADFDAAIAASPKYSGVFEERGRFREGKKDVAGALSDYSEAITLDPRSTSSFERRGLLLMRERRDKEALADFDAIVRLSPKVSDAANRPLPGIPRAHLQRAYVLARTGELAASEKACEEALRLDPKLADALAWRAQSRFSKGDSAGAVADFRDAARLEPDNPAVLAGMAMVLAIAPEERIRDGAAAVRSASRAVELSGGKVPVYRLGLAMAQAEKGDFDAAILTVQAVEDEIKANDRLRILTPSLRDLFRAKTPFRIPPGGLPGGFPAIMPGVID